MGLFSPPKPKSAPLPSKVEEPVDSDALARARKRAEAEKARVGRDKMKIDLQSAINPAAANGSGVVIP